MRLRYRFIMPIAALCIIAAAGSALAAKRVVPTPGVGVPSTIGTESAAAYCALGTPGPMLSGFTGLIYPGDDNYSQLLDPAVCSPCPNGTYLLTAAHLGLAFTSPCNLSGYVTIIGAQPDPTSPVPGCLVPDPSVVICPLVPFSFGRTAAEPAVCTDFSVALPAGCCINQKVFVRWQFIASNCPNDPTFGNSDIAFCTSTAPVDCTQYNDYAGSGGYLGFFDLAPLLVSNGLNAIVMYVDAECCEVVPTLPRSWGRMKQLYR